MYLQGALYLKIGWIIESGAFGADHANLQQNSESFFMRKETTGKGVKL